MDPLLCRQERRTGRTDCRLLAAMQEYCLEEGITAGHGGGRNVVAAALAAGRLQGPAAGSSDSHRERALHRRPHRRLATKPRQRSANCGSCAAPAFVARAMPHTMIGCPMSQHDKMLPLTSFLQEEMALSIERPDDEFHRLAALRHAFAAAGISPLRRRAQRLVGGVGLSPRRAICA